MPSYRTMRTPVGRPWQARVQHAHRRIHLGYWASAEEAERAERAYRRLHQIPDLSARAHQRRYPVPDEELVEASSNEG